MITGSTAAVRSFLVLALFCFSLVSLADAPEAKITLQLVWGTNDAISPNPHHKPVDEHLSRKLKNSPYKWKNYFEVNRKAIGLPLNQSKKVVMSDKLTLELKNMGEERLEIKVFGSDKFISRQVETLSKGPILIGGDAKNDTAWFVAITTSK